MHDRYEPPNTYSWSLYGVAVMIVGGLAGYVISTQNGGARNVAGAAVPSPAAPAASVADESELRAYRDILARDPRNAAAAVKAGNMLYDAQRYVEAIAFYQQAYALNDRDINVSTDLATALWYAGRADEALSQYEKSLALDGHHAQTLFNLGIVRADGKHDYAAAIAAWETLLRTNPEYPAVGRVRELIADARRQTGTSQLK